MDTPNHGEITGQIIFQSKNLSDYHPQSLTERLLLKLEGVMLVVRLDARLGTSAKTAGVLLASVQKGSAAIPKIRAQPKRAPCVLLPSDPMVKWLAD